MNTNEDKMVQNAIFDSGQTIDIFHKDVKTLRTYLDPRESPSQIKFTELEIYLMNTLSPL